MHKDKSVINNLIVIGNGFDLFLGLRSSFTEFLDSYKKLDNSLKNIFKYFKQINKIGQRYTYKNNEIDDLLIIRYLCNIPIKNRPKTPPLIGQDTRQGIENDLLFKCLAKHVNDFINRNELKTCKKININFWILYLFIRKKEGDYNWSSIEEQIYNFFMKNDFNNLLISLSKSLSININITASRSNDFLGNKYERIIIYILLFIEKHQILSFSKSHKDKINNFNQLESNLYDFLQRELSIFEYKLNNYLQKACINKYKNIYGISYYNIGSHLLDCLSSSKTFSLINFNYTKPTKNYIKFHNESLYSVRNIHGTLHKTYDSRYSPVIGISDKNININNPIYIFTKNYKIMRLSCNEYHNILEPRVKNIIFFGHSFDKADYNYFFDIFDRYKIYDIQNTNVKLIFYYVNYDNQSDNTAAINQINNVNRLLKDYCIKKYSINPNNRAKYLIQTLSFEGRIVIRNLYNKIQDTTTNNKLLIYYISIIDSIKELLLKIYNSRLKKNTNKFLRSISNNIKAIIKIINNINNYYDKRNIQNVMDDKQLATKYKKFLGKINNIHISHNLSNKRINYIIKEYFVNIFLNSKS